jgi:hypothetical protein
MRASGSAGLSQGAQASAGGGESEAAKAAEAIGKRILYFAQHMEARRRDDVKRLDGMSPHVSYNDPEGVLKPAIDKLNALVSILPPPTTPGAVSIQAKLDTLGVSFVRDLKNYVPYDLVIEGVAKVLQDAQQQANDGFQAEIAKLDVDIKSCVDAVARIKADASVPDADKPAMIVAEEAKMQPKIDERKELIKQQQEANTQFQAMQDIGVGPIRLELERIHDSMEVQNQRDFVRTHENRQKFGTFSLALDVDPKDQSTDEIKKAHADKETAGFIAEGIDKASSEIPKTGIYGKDQDNKETDHKIRWEAPEGPNGSPPTSATASPFPQVYDYTATSKREEFDQAWGRVFDMLASKFDKIAINPGNMSPASLKRMIEMVKSRDRYIQLDKSALDLMSGLTAKEVNKIMEDVKAHNDARALRKSGGSLSDVIKETTAKPEAISDKVSVREIEVAMEKMETAMILKEPAAKQVELFQKLATVLREQSTLLESSFNVKSEGTVQRFEAIKSAADKLAYASPLVTAAIDKDLAGPDKAAAVKAVVSAEGEGVKAKAAAERVEVTVNNDKALSLSSKARP